MNSLLVLQNRAIKAAQEERWEDAQQLNKDILKQDAKNVSALNRLGFAYLQAGNVDEAKKTYNKVLKLDSTNSVAKKYLDVIAKSSKKKMRLPKALKHSDFIDEPGKTKSVQLVRLADANVVENLSVGEECELKSTKSRISVNCEGTYVGTLPDDVTARLQPLMKAGNRYSVKVQSLKSGNVRVFLREVERGEGVEHVTSFPTENVGLLSVDTSEIAREDEEPVIVTETGEDDNDRMLDNSDIDEVISSGRSYRGRDDSDDDDDDEDVDDERDEL